MKNLFFLVTMFSLSAVAAEGKLVKSCTTTLIQPGETFKVETKVEIYKKGNSSLFAKVTQKSNGEVSSYEDIAALSESPVRAGLTGDLNDTRSLNLAEKLVIHAMNITEDPIMDGAFSAGMTLKNIRSAKVYTVGKIENMGLSAIVEAKDKSGKAMGSFFGGFLVSPCK